MSDDTLVIDLSNYKDRVGSRVPEGPYKVQVEDAESTTSSTNNPMVNLWLRIVGGEFDGQTITDRLVMTEKSLFRVVGFLQAINIPTPKQQIRINLRQIIGRYLEVDVADGQPYNGRVRSEVRGYNRVVSASGGDVADEFEGLSEFASVTDATSNEVTDLPEAAPAAPAPAQTAPKAETVAEAAVADDGSVDLSSIDL